MKEASDSGKIYIKEEDIKKLVIRCYILVGGGVLIGAAVTSISGDVFVAMFLPMLALKIVLDSWIKAIRGKRK